MALGLAQMVLDVQENLKPTQIYMLNNFCFNNFPKKLIPGDARGQVLQEPVSASHAVQGWKSGAFGIRVEMSNKNSGRCYDKRNQDVLSAPYEIRD